MATKLKPVETIQQTYLKTVDERLNFIRNKKDYKKTCGVEANSVLDIPVETSCWPHCWWCTYPYSHHPICMPCKYDEKKAIMQLEGFFCSWQCGKAFVLNKNSADMYNQCTLITLLHKRLNGSLSQIKTAPDRYSLTKFGGHLTIEQFRENSWCLVKNSSKTSIDTKFNFSNPRYSNLNKESLNKQSIRVKQSSKVEKDSLTEETLCDYGPLLLNEESFIKPITSRIRAAAAANDKELSSEETTNGKKIIGDQLRTSSSIGGKGGSTQNGSTARSTRSPMVNSKNVTTLETFMNIKTTSNK